eukprot:CAMPEP_0202697088 /NCGR_PEP_ID=MMETSP1385-20130828/10418_1 /ASSEMBLY_ACC=CAM_ASM_000861 /TAXON_ID=933848 /ORGANISM="Elphidium margaritaceum" /LENGTH=198 /DNA_ID=CAMNT_0049353455 /DNA_START=39 /DNA_END=635 /DNA_ORIENTATION=-
MATQHMNKIPEYKIVVLGGGGVGKSALTIRLVNGDFVEEYDPTIEDSYRKQMQLDKETVMLDVLDTAGQDDFAALRDAWMREAEGFLLVYSITKEATFDEAKELYNRIQRVKEDEEDAHIHLVLVGNKCDLETQRQVEFVDGKALADEWGCPFYETSAKTKINNIEPFFDCCRLIRDANKHAVQPIIEKNPGCACQIL